MVNSRQKGARAERQLAHKLSDCGFSCRRGQQYSGANGDADVVGLPFIHIECKAVEKLNLYKAIEQSQQDAREGEIPVVVHKKNRSAWYMTIALDEVIEWYRAWLRQEEEKIDIPD